MELDKAIQEAKNDLDKDYQKANPFRGFNRHARRMFKALARKQENG